MGAPKNEKYVRNNEQISLGAQKGHSNIEDTVCGALVDQMKELYIESV
jgi:hypothetical protein